MAAWLSEHVAAPRDVNAPYFQPSVVFARDVQVLGVGGALHSFSVWCHTLRDVAFTGSQRLGPITAELVRPGVGA